MRIQVLDTKEGCGRAAAGKAVEILREALRNKERARFVAATGASQFDFLETLTSAPGIAWDRTEMFHLDEYVAMAPDHPASFRRYLRERLIDKVHPGTVHLIDGTADAEAECRRLSQLYDAAPIDVVFCGIGENGHLAFNDPPADFETDRSFIVVDLDEACRRQQMGEGWFAELEEVPARAITLTIPAIMRAEHVICTVPERRKAAAVRDCLSGDASVGNMRPASILKNHQRAWVFLDQESAALLRD